MMQKYGATQTAPVAEGYHDEVDYSGAMTLAGVAREGGRISRVRILTERVPGEGRVADVSYVHATMPDGSIVPVKGVAIYLAPFHSIKAEFVAWAREEGVYAKALGLLDEANWSVMSS